MKCNSDLKCIKLLELGMQMLSKIVSYHNNWLINPYMLAVLQKSCRKEIITNRGSCFFDLSSMAQQGTGTIPGVILKVQHLMAPDRVRLDGSITTWLILSDF